MAIERNCATLMLKARREGVTFGRSLMLGHQGLRLSRTEYDRFLHLAGAQAETPMPAYADGLFRALGATQVDVMDFSDYEGANLLHDLNQPIPDVHRAGFDVVVDGGTLEHVFNFPVAIRNCMEMVRPGGRFFSATIPNNWCGHGFYQFSPELFFRVLSAENGFRVEGMYLAELDASRWWSIRDPAEARSRAAGHPALGAATLRPGQRPLPGAAKPPVRAGSPPSRPRPKPRHRAGPVAVLRQNPPLEPAAPSPPAPWG